VNDVLSEYIFIDYYLKTKENHHKMPNYVYRCKQCSYEFEEFQRISASALVTCPKCKTDNLVRIFQGGVGLHFKGSGFYLTDYKKSGSSISSSSSDSGKNKEEKKTETKKAETKPSEPTSSDAKNKK
jgi:putative FmdB family regulatory protein